MRKLNRRIDLCRVRGGRGGTHAAYGMNGVFILPGIKGQLICIVSDGGGWDHVSVERWDNEQDPRVPDWAEMCYVKRFFFEDDEAAMQLHPREKDYIDVHSYVLHLWRPNNGMAIPLPPKEFV